MQSFAKQQLIQRASTIKSSIRMIPYAGVGQRDRDQEIEKIRESLAELADLVGEVCSQLPDD